MAGKLKGLQQWCRHQCEGYRDVNITNMTSSWKSGLAFCAIIHRFRPDLIDYESLSKENVYYNNKLAFDVASSLGIAALLDASDMVEMEVPDKLCIITYVAQYHSFFRDKTPMTGEQKKRKTSIPQASIDHNGYHAPAAKHLKLPNDELPQPSAGDGDRYSAKNDDDDDDEVAMPPPASYGGRRRGSIVDDVCHACQGRVYVLERHLTSDGLLFHRSCYRRDSMSSTLRRSAKNKENIVPTEQSIPLQQTPDNLNVGEDCSRTIDSGSSVATKEPHHAEKMREPRTFSDRSRATMTGSRPLSAVLERQLSAVDDKSGPCTVSSPHANDANNVSSSSTIAHVVAPSSAAAASVIGNLLKLHMTSKLPVTRRLTVALPSESQSSGIDEKSTSHVTWNRNENDVTLTTGVNGVAEATASVGRGSERFAANESSPESLRSTKQATDESTSQPGGAEPRLRSPVSSGNSSNGTVTTSNSVVTPTNDYSHVMMRAKPAEAATSWVREDLSRRFTYCANATPLSAVVNGLSENNTHRIAAAPSSVGAIREDSAAEVNLTSGNKAPAAAAAAPNCNGTTSEAKSSIKCSLSQPSSNVALRCTSTSPSGATQTYRHSTYVSPPSSFVAMSQLNISSASPVRDCEKQTTGGENDCNNNVKSTRLVEDEKRQQARDLLGNTVADAQDRSKRYSAPMRAQWNLALGRQSSNGDELSSSVREQVILPTITPGAINISLASDGRRLQRAENQNYGRSTASPLPGGCIMPNRADVTQIRHSVAASSSSVSMTSPTTNAASSVVVPQQSSAQSKNGAVDRPPVGKAEWQLEAERRRAMRNGVFVDPEKNPAAYRSSGGLRTAASMENILTSRATESNRMVCDDFHKSSASFNLQQQQQQVSSHVLSATTVESAGITSEVVRKTENKSVMSDQRVDILRSTPRQSIVIDPARRQAAAARKEQMSSAGRFASSVDCLSTLTDESFGLSSSGTNRDTDIGSSSGQRDTLTAEVRSNANQTPTAVNRGAVDSSPSKSTAFNHRSTERPVEVRRPSIDFGKRRTIVVDSNQLSRKLRDSALRLAVSMDDLSAPSTNGGGAVETTTEPKAAARTCYDEVRLTRGVGDFASADDVLSSKTSKSRISRAPAFRIADSGENTDDEDWNEEGDRRASSTLSIDNGGRSSDNGSNAMECNGGSDRLATTCRTDISPTKAANPRATHDEDVNENNTDDERLDELDVELCEVERNGRTLEERIRGGTGESMTDDEDEVMAQWYALVKKRNDLVKEESILLYKRRQLELEETTFEIKSELTRLMRKPSKLKSSSDKKREENLTKQLVKVVAQRNTISDDMENELKKYMQEDERLAKMMLTPGFNNRRRSSVLAGLRPSTRHGEPIESSVNPNHGNKTKHKWVQIFFGKKASSPKKANKTRQKSQEG